MLPRAESGKILESLETMPSQFSITDISEDNITVKVERNAKSSSSQFFPRIFRLENLFGVSFDGTNRMYWTTVGIGVITTHLSFDISQVKALESQSLQFTLHDWNSVKKGNPAILTRWAMRFC